MVGGDVDVGIGVGVIVNLAGASPSTILNDCTFLRSDTSTSENRLEVPARSLRFLTNPSGSLLMESSAMVPRSGGVHAGPPSPSKINSFRIQMNIARGMFLLDRNSRLHTEPTRARGWAVLSSNNYRKIQGA